MVQDIEQTNSDVKSMQNRWAINRSNPNSQSSKQEIDVRTKIQEEIDNEINKINKIIRDAEIDIKQ